MSDNKPFSFLSSSITLNSFQREEFIRISEIYNKVYNHLLLQWRGYAARKALPHITGADFRHIDERLRNLLHFAKWIDPEEKQIAYFAANELCRVLKDHDYNDLTFSVSLDTLFQKVNDEVIFYRDYNIKVKDKTVCLPVIGKAKIGRFDYFTGSIRAVGVRTDANEDLECVIYYKENDDLFNVKEPTVWRLEGNQIPMSHLNVRLRQAGIGFMM